MQEFSGPSGMHRGFNVEFKAPAAETVSTTHNFFDTGIDGGSLAVKVAVTASAGTTPTLTVIVEGSEDNSNWVPLATIGSNGYMAGGIGTAVANFTAAATARAVVPRTQFVRTRSVVGGTTPSFTYSVEGIVC